MDTIQQRNLLVESLIDLIQKGNAHASFEDAISGMPIDQLSDTPAQLPYSVWQLVEHIRIAQWDIVEFCINPNHESPKWPDEYWVHPTGDITEMQWNQSLEQIRQDRERFFTVLRDLENDLFSPLPHGSGQTILKEALLIADHNAYHVGEIIVIRRLLKNWGK
jgi:hypothetical protein